MGIELDEVKKLKIEVIKKCNNFFLPLLTLKIKAIRIPASPP